MWIIDSKNYLIAFFEVKVDINKILKGVNEMSNNDQPQEQPKQPVKKPPVRPATSPVRNVIETFSKKK